MKKNIILLCLIVLTQTVGFSQGLMNAVKGKKTRTAAKEINARIPNATEWATNVDALIQSKDVNGLIALQWQYRFVEIYGMGENDYSIEAGIPIYHNEEEMQFGGSPEKFKEYYIKVGVALADLKKLDFVLEGFTDSLCTIANESGSFNRTDWVAGSENFIALINAIDEHLKKNNQSSFEQNAVAILNSTTLPANIKNGCASTLAFYLNSYKTAASMTKLNEAMLPYFDGKLKYASADVVMWMEYWARINYQKAIPKVVSALQSENTKIRYTAVWTCGALKAKTTLSKLELIAQKDPFYYVDDYGYKVYEIRDAANEAIQKIKLAE